MALEASALPPAARFYSARLQPRSIGLSLFDFLFQLIKSLVSLLESLEFITQRLR